jgi:hypothetical protein
MCAVCWPLSYYSAVHMLLLHHFAIITAHAAFKTFEEAARSRNFSTADAIASSYCIGDFSEVLTQEVEWSAQINRSSAGKRCCVPIT